MSKVLSPTRKFPAMRAFALPLLAVAAVTAFAQSPASMPMNMGPAPGERLGTVNFAVSCSPQVQAPFSRGVALLHDFWYAEARPQFERIAKDDPSCAMARWGIAMSVFHQIWDRPDDHAMKLDGRRCRKPNRRPPTPRANAITLRRWPFFSSPAIRYSMARVSAYSAAMGTLYRKYPDDIDAGAFYALSLLASEAPDDTSLRHEHEAMAVLAPLYATQP